MRVSRVLVGAMFAATLPAAAWAQATAEEAETIRQGIQEWIDTYIDSPNFDVQMGGEIEVSPSGDVFDVAFPSTQVVMDGDVRFVIDFFDMTLAPTGDGFYDATWQMPERFPVVDASGNEEGVITVDKQFGTGVFAPAYQTFITLDLSLEDILVAPHNEEGELAIESVAMVVESDDLGDGVFDSEFEMTIADVAFSAEREGSFSLGLLALEGSVSEIDMPAYIAFTEESNALMESIEASGEADSAVFTAFADLLDRTPKLLDAMDIEYVLRDLYFEEDGEAVDIGEARYGMSVDGLYDDASTLGMSILVEDVVVEPAPPEFQYVPQETVIRLALEDLPNDQLLMIVVDFLRGAAQTNPDNAMMMAAGQLQQAVMVGGSTLQIEEVRAIADIYTLLMQGEVIPRADAAFGVTADAFMEIGGMPQLIAMLQNEPQGQEAVQALTVLQGLGQQGTNDAGEDVRIYELNLGADGTMLLNGTDLGPLLQGMMQ